MEQSRVISWPHLSPLHMSAVGTTFVLILSFHLVSFQPTQAVTYQRRNWNPYELLSLFNNQAPDSTYYWQKRFGPGIGSEFLGKRSAIKRVPGSEFLGKRVPGSEFLGKRVPGSEFLGKRVPGSEFLGKRVPGSEFLGKRVPGSEFLGKRVPGSEFLGKRVPGSEFLGKRAHFETDGNNVDMSLVEGGNGGNSDRIPNLFKRSPEMPGNTILQSDRNSFDASIDNVNDLHGLQN